MDTEKMGKKKGRKSSLTLYRSSKQFHVKNPVQNNCVQAKHDPNDHADDHGNVPTTSKHKMHTTCQVQTTCSMSKMAVA